MDAIAFGLLLVFLFKAIWDFAANDFVRTTMVQEYREKPITHIVFLIWIISILMFFVGIFVPTIGRLKIAETGWHVFEVCALGFFGIFFVNLFFDFNKLDKR